MSENDDVAGNSSNTIGLHEKNAVLISNNTIDTINIRIGIPDSCPIKSEMSEEPLLLLNNNSLSNLAVGTKWGAAQQYERLTWPDLLVEVGEAARMVLEVVKAAVGMEGPFQLWILDMLALRAAKEGVEIIQAELRRWLWPRMRHEEHPYLYYGLHRKMLYYGLHWTINVIGKCDDILEYVAPAVVAAVPTQSGKLEMMVDELKDAAKELESWSQTIATPGALGDTASWVAPRRQQGSQEQCSRQPRRTGVVRSRFPRRTSTE